PPRSLRVLFIRSLLLCSSTHHVYLHSFPTRRSSDLAVRDESSPIPSRWAREFVRRQGLDPHGSWALGWDTPSTGPGHTPSSSGRDRKSTRLNSSHGSISYAVFCLKKKLNLCRYTR